MNRLLAAGLLLLLAQPAAALNIEKISVTRGLPGVQGIMPAGSGGPDAQDVEVVSGLAFILPASGVTIAQRDAALTGFGAVYLRELPGSGGWSVVKLSPGTPVALGLQQLAALPQITDVSPDHAYRVSKIPGDPLAYSMYHLGKVNAFAGWEFETGSSSQVTVAVLDAGVDSTHPELSPKMASLTHHFCDPGANKLIGGDNVFCYRDPSATPACNHGTRVAGVAAAAANNGQGGAGISWGAQIWSLRIFRTGDCTTDCGGPCGTDDQAIIDALTLVRSSHNIAGVGKIVVNLSIGDPTGAVRCPTDALPVDNAISLTVGVGIPVIVAAGNYPGASSGGPVQSPGNCQDAMPVGATDALDNVAGFSARGAELAARGVVAPGVSVMTTDLGGGYTTADGTSFSAPIVSGLAALILANKPNTPIAGGAGNNGVMNHIRDASEGIGLSGMGVLGYGLQGNTVGAGRVNAFRTMKLTVEGTLAGFKGDEESIAFPNPFRPSTHGTTTITIPPAIAGQKPSVKVYTVDGQLVRDLEGNTTWDGKNDSRVSVATGVYVFVVKTTNGMNRGRVALIR